jgi:hypothetical protein
LVAVKISPLVVLLVGLAIGGLAFGFHQAGRATDAELRLEAALAAQRDSASRWTASRDSLMLRMRRLRADSQVLALRYRNAAQAAWRAHRTADSLLARLPDTLRVGIRLVFDSLAEETMACANLLQNCELRARNAEARTRGDSIQLVRLTALTDTLEAAWRSAERRARPSFFRDLWRSRKVTLPLAALSVFLLVTRR